MRDSPTIMIKRIYDPPTEQDGLRVLVDRLWPRGVKKKDANVDVWAKQLAPSSELRKWFNHQPARFDEFRIRYLNELQDSVEAAASIRAAAGDRVITLLYAARDRSCNHALVLQEFLS